MLRAYQDTTHKKPENKNIPGIHPTKEYPHLYGEVILCLFIDIAHDTNPYKNIINQATRIKI
jgi:hypothetical protein